MYGQIHQGTTYKILPAVLQVKHANMIISRLEELRWLPVASELFYRDAIMAFKCMSGCAPEYLSSQLLNVLMSVIVELAIHRNCIHTFFKKQQVDKEHFITEL